MQNFLCAAMSAWLAFSIFPFPTVAAPTPQSSGAQPYRFELVGPPFQAGGIGKQHEVDSKSVVRVRVVHLPDGAVVPNAALTRASADMSPDGMPEMTARVRVLPPARGIYRLEVHPSMQGDWALQLAARIPGETAEIRGMVVADLNK